MKPNKKANRQKISARVAEQTARLLTQWDVQEKGVGIVIDQMAHHCVVTEFNPSNSLKRLSNAQ